MTDSRAAVGLDRLPWLTDEPKARKQAGGRGLLGWAVAAVILVAAVSYWLGVNSAPQPDHFAESSGGGAVTRAPLPNPRPAPPPAAPVVEPVTPSPTVEPVAAPPLPSSEAAVPAARSASAKSSSLVRSRKPAPRPRQVKTERKAKRSVTKPASPQIWPARVVTGASGRLVRIGTFTTRRQAKKGWWAVMRAYPGMQRLPAVVVPVQSMRNRRTYYRIQMGTTSHAHSTVLCQRMRIIGQSCVVIDDRRSGKTGI